MSLSPAPLFTPFKLKNLTLPNRIVMAPMTRSKSPGQIPGEDVAAYYARRAEGGVGLIITEGVAPDHPVALNDHNVPNFHGDALDGWAKVLKAVKAQGGLIMPQLWHTGLMRKPGSGPNPHMTGVGPSGLAKPGKKVAEPMSTADIDAVIAGYATSARHAEELGFDGVEIHGAHGYLIDQFFWEGTNERPDAFGGDMIKRTKFAVEVIKGIRAAVSKSFPCSCAGRSGSNKTMPSNSPPRPKRSKNSWNHWLPPASIASTARHAAFGSRSSRTRT